MGITAVHSSAGLIISVTLKKSCEKHALRQVILKVFSFLRPRKSFQCLPLVLSVPSLAMMSFRQGLLVTSRNLYTSTSIMAPTVVLENMNPCIKKMEYAVRGPLVIRANAIEKVSNGLVPTPFY